MSLKKKKSQKEPKTDGKPLSDAIINKVKKLIGSESFVLVKVIERRENGFHSQSICEGVQIREILRICENLEGDLVKQFPDAVMGYKLKRLSEVIGSVERNKTKKRKK